MREEVQEREKAMREEVQEREKAMREEVQEREKAMREEMRDEAEKREKAMWEQMRDEMRKSSVEGSISVMADQPSLSLSLPTTPATSTSLEKHKSFTSKTKKSFSRIIGNLMPSSNSSSSNSSSSISSNTSTSTVETKWLSSSPHDAFKRSKKASKKYKDDDNSDDLTAAL